MKYPFSVVLSQEGDETMWIAKSTCLKGCIGVGDTPDEAVCELAENEAMWLETAEELGLEIPQIPVEEENPYSGKISLRISPSQHKKAAELAKREGISLNQFMSDAIATYSAEIRDANYFSDKIINTAQRIEKKFLIESTSNTLNRDSIYSVTKPGIVYAQ